MNLNDGNDGGVDDDDNDDGGGVGWHNLKHLFVTGRPYLVSLLLSRSSLRLHITRLNIS